MRRQLPNALTIFRLILAGVFFIVLNRYRYGAEPWRDQFAGVAIILFIIAAISDYLDGYLARKWHVETAFGRVMDPFCDKVLVLGAFIYLSGPRFVMPEAVEAKDPLTMVSGVYPWMVAIMLARELLVTGIRGEMEDQGIQFGAKFIGKLKTALQLVAVPAILAIVLYNPRLPGHHWSKNLRDVIVYATVIATVASGWPYVSSAWRAMRDSRK